MEDSKDITLSPVSLRVLPCNPLVSLGVFQGVSETRESSSLLDVLPVATPLFPVYICLTNFSVYISYIRLFSCVCSSPIITLSNRPVSSVGAFTYHLRVLVHVNVFGVSTILSSYFTTGMTVLSPMVLEREGSYTKISRDVLS